MGLVLQVVAGVVMRCFCSLLRDDCSQQVQLRHVGEPLRKLTLEDRLELRRQTREREKKRSVFAEIDAAEESDELVDDRPAKRTKSGGEVNGIWAASRFLMFP